MRIRKGTGPDPRRPSQLPDGVRPPGTSPNGRVFNKEWLCAVGPRLTIPGLPTAPPTPKTDASPRRRKKPRRDRIYFSEQASEHAEYGPGCVTYPVDMITDPDEPEVRVRIEVHGSIKAPTDLPVGEIQIDPSQVVAVQAAGYACCRMPAREMQEYCEAARRRPVKHWHPTARLVQY